MLRELHQHTDDGNRFTLYFDPMKNEIYLEVIGEKIGQQWVNVEPNKAMHAIRHPLLYFTTKKDIAA